MPAIVDRSPVIVAVGSSGEAPVLTRRLRESLEAFLPQRLGVLAKLAGRLRSAVKARLESGAARRRFWEKFLRWPDRRGRARRSRAGGRRGGRCRHRSTACESGGARATGRRSCARRRRPRRSRSADVARIARAAECRCGAVRPARFTGDSRSCASRCASASTSARQPGRPTCRRRGSMRCWCKLASEGKRVCRLKGGDPFIFGRGGEELEALAANGIRFEVVPGITAAAGCAAYAGIPLTHRDYAQSLTFVTGHCKGETDNVDWEALARPDQTVVFYMGLSHLETSSRSLRSTVCRLIARGCRDRAGHARDAARRHGNARRAGSPRESRGRSSRRHCSSSEKSRACTTHCIGSTRHKRIALNRSRSLGIQQGGCRA